MNLVFIFLVALQVSDIVLEKYLYFVVENKNSEKFIRTIIILYYAVYINKNNSNLMFRVTLAVCWCSQ